MGLNRLNFEVNMDKDFLKLHDQWTINIKCFLNSEEKQDCTFTHLGPLWALWPVASFIIELPLPLTVPALPVGWTQSSEASALLAPGPLILEERWWETTGLLSWWIINGGGVSSCGGALAHVLWVLRHLGLFVFLLWLSPDELKSILFLQKNYFTL